MKNTAIILMFLILFVGCGKTEMQTQKQTVAIDNNYTAYTALISNYVDSGRVNYTGLKTDHSTLDSLIVSLENPDLKPLNESQKLAFYINAYNMITIKSVVDAYPVKSIKDIDGVWDKKRWVVGGRELTLNDIEHEVLRKEFKEPRIHFAIVCASIGCPPLLSEPFLPDSLENQLKSVSRNFALNGSYTRVDIEKETAMLSSIFDWFGDDFIEDYYDSSTFGKLSKRENASLNFIISQFPIGEQEKLKQIEFKIKYLDYDWSLNDRK